MGGAPVPAHMQPARVSGAAALGAGLLLACALLTPGANAAAAEPHGETLAALADTRAAIAEIVQAEDQIVNSPTPYRRAAQRAINAIVGEGDRRADKVSGNPSDAAGAIGHVNSVLDRRDSPPWVDALHGVQVNLGAAVARLRDALKARGLDDYQLNVSAALLNLQAAVGQPAQTGVFGGLTGALATTALGIPEGAHQVSACAPVAGAPAYGVKDGYLAFVAVPSAAGTADVPEDFGSRNISVQGDWLIVRTAAAPLVAELCRKGSAARPQAQADPPRSDPLPKGDPPARDPTVPLLPQDGGHAPALYTRAQALQGKEVYRQYCVECHGKDLQGALGPALAGPGFLQTAQSNHWTLYIIQYLAMNTMPLHSPGTLSPEQYANVLAFLLAANCYPAGDKPFPQKEEAQFKSIPLHPYAGVQARYPELGTCEALK